MEPRSSCSLGRQLQQLGAEMGALQAGQAAALRELARELARERAQARRLHEKVARLQEKLRRGQRRGQQDQPEAGAPPPGSAQGEEPRQPDASGEVARLREELARQRAQREALAKDYQELCHSHRRLRRLCSTRCPRCLQGPGDPGSEDPEGPPPVDPDSEDPEGPLPGDLGSEDPEGPPPVDPGSEDPEGPPPGDPGSEDAQSKSLKGTQTQRKTVRLKPFIFFIVASTMIFLYPWDSWKEC